MSEKVHEVPESILKELFLAARGTARRDYITSSLSEALDFAEKVLSPPMERHFVEFMSPGTFFPEVTSKPIDAWDVDAAVVMAAEIVERYGARPFGFRFITRSRTDADLDSKQTACSAIYYLGGTIHSAEEVLSRDDPKEAVLRTNIRSNGIKRIIVNDNSWRFTAELNDDDVVLDVTLPPRPGGEEP